MYKVNPEDKRRPNNVYCKSFCLFEESIYRRVSNGMVETKDNGLWEILIHKNPSFESCQPNSNVRMPCNLQWLPFVITDMSLVGKYKEIKLKV